MKSAISFLTGFRAKVTLALVAAMLFVAATSNYFLYSYLLDTQLDQLREKLMIIAQTAALAIDADMLEKVPMNRDGALSPAYRTIAGKLAEIKRANPPIEYIYTMAKTGRGGMLRFVVDPDPVARKARRKGPTAYPGDVYDASRFPEMLRAFEGPSADRDLVVDEWGVVLSGYAPVRGRGGKAVAILGVDLTAADVRRARDEVRRRGLLVMAFGSALSIAAGIAVSRGICRRVRMLAEGTRRLARGELGHRVEVEGRDELGELARSFNEMAADLRESRERLHDYFYRVMQSLVRVIEAKDVYTRGHSERVAGYAEKIASAMGLGPEKAALVTRAARLHDIGKVAIRESVLNKEGALTDREVEMMQEHPAMGEDILKPAVFDEELLAIVRSHHERYDGVGYPDRIDGEHLSVLAQIISISDAYDAMTSDRAYRPALSRERAVEELKKSSGTQFNPRVVEALLKVLGA